MKKKLTFQKKIIANLNHDQMSSVNGGDASGIMSCIDPPKQTKDGIACNGDVQSNATLCKSVNFCHSVQWCSGVGFE